ncbi:MAG: hypothetical protein ACRDYC_10610 [Acidimicrobiales bacterium]
MEAPFDPRADADQLDQAERILADVEASLARLEDGTWRSCEVCGEALGADELADTPYLRRCSVHRA